MAYATPRVAKQHDHVINAKDAKQSSERNMQGWKCELDDKIWTVMMPVKEYLSKVVPCNEALPDLQAIHPFDVPTGGREIDMYEPMVCNEHRSRSQRTDSRIACRSDQARRELYTSETPDLLQQRA